MSLTTTILDPDHAQQTRGTYDYLLYGIRLRSRIKLTLEEVSGHEIADIELAPAETGWMETKISAVELKSSEWVNVHQLSGGWSYVYYDGMFDFLISPLGDRILFRLLADVPLECFQAYALGRIFSFALVKSGYEPLHAATVVIGQRAVAFLGASSFGKSSLAACFIASGCSLLTDDVLRLQEQPDGSYIAYPGPPHLKLSPRLARFYIGDMTVRPPINLKHPNPKRVYPLTPAQSYSIPVPLAAIYAVTSPRTVYRKQRIAIHPLPAVDALVKVLSFTHNHELTGRERLARQFEAARRLIDKIPVRSLSYPRILQNLPEVKAAILADLD